MTWDYLGLPGTLLLLIHFASAPCLRATTLALLATSAGLVKFWWPCCRKPPNQLLIHVVQTCSKSLSQCKGSTHRLEQLSLAMLPIRSERTQTQNIRSFLHQLRLALCGAAAFAHTAYPITSLTKDSCGQSPSNKCHKLIPVGCEAWTLALHSRR